MKIKTKKVISFLLALFMVAGMLQHIQKPFYAFADETQHEHEHEYDIDIEGINIYYSVDDDLRYDPNKEYEVENVVIDEPEEENTIDFNDCISKFLQSYYEHDISF